MFLKLCQYVKDILNIWYVQQFKTQKMCHEAVQRVSDQYKTQKMCNEIVKKSPWMLDNVPDQFVTQKM